MSSIQVPALQPVQQPDLMGSLAKLLGLKQAMGQQQLQQQALQTGELENQQRQYEMDATKATNEAYQNAVKLDGNGKPMFDTDALAQSLSSKGFGSRVPDILKHVTDYEQSRANLEKTTQELQVNARDTMGALGSALQKANYDPQLAQTLIQHTLQDPGLPQQGKAQLMQMQQQISQNPGAIKQLADSFVAQSPKYSELASQATTAAAHQSQADTARQRLTAEMPKLQADNTIAQANAAVAPQNARLGIQQKQGEIAKNAAELQKIRVETENLGEQPIFAVDPKTNERVMTTRPEAKSLGYTNPVSVKEGDVAKETDARAMINDVQLNKSRYLTAMQNVYCQPMTKAQMTAMTTLTPEKLGLDFGSLFKLELPDVMQKVTNASAFSVLIPAQKQAVVGYYSTLASVPAAQKALTNIGKANKEMMDLELRTIPTPLMDQGTFQTMLDRFQGNIDQTSRKTVRLPGMPSTAEIRNEIEASKQQKPSRDPFDNGLMSLLGGSK